MKKVILIGAGLLVLAGCTTPPKHTCELNSKDGRCASLEQAYQVSSQMDDVSQFQNVFEAGAKTPRASGSARASFTPEGYAQPRDRGKPVFVPPKVHRVWTAPWTDAEGQLHGGEYVYFTTPGKWSYGSLRAPGEASGVFRPVLEDTYGFVPVAPKVNERKDAPVTQNSEFTRQVGANLPTTTRNGVTQPQATLAE
jgi:type IV conjugative transfer system lipoprotein TraV